jgi:hypothetical protein
VWSTAPNTLSLSLSLSHDYVSTWVHLDGHYLVPSLHALLREGEEVSEICSRLPRSPSCACGRSLSHELFRCFSLSRSRLHSQRVAKRNVLLMKKKLPRPALCARRERERQRKTERERDRERERLSRASIALRRASVHVCMYMSVICVCKFHLRTHPPPAAMQTPHGEKNAFESNSASVGRQILEVKRIGDLGRLRTSSG